MKILIYCSAILVCAVVSSAQNTSVYTSTKANNCRTIVSSSYGTGSYVGRCRGVGGYQLEVVEGDIRQTVNIITPQLKKFELNFWDFYSNFSSVGDRAEWRMKRGQPVAMILRYIVSDPVESTKTTSYLMVSKISRTGACVTDTVPPGPDQNAKARELADKAQHKQCGQP